MLIKYLFMSKRSKSFIGNFFKKIFEKFEYLVGIVTFWPLIKQFEISKLNILIFFSINKSFKNIKTFLIGFNIAIASFF